MASVTTIDGRPSPATSEPLTAPKPPPAASVPSPTTAIGRPDRASSPATTPQMLKIEPIEMSICRQRITSVIPTAATSTGALLTTSGRSWSARKNRGATTARTSRSTTNAAATDSSRR